MKPHRLLAFCPCASKVLKVSIFLLILGSLLLLDLVWWWWVDSRLRRANALWRVRIWPLLWAGAMGGFLLLLIFSRDLDFPVRDYYPLPLLAILYVWHLLVLPGWLLVAPVAQLIRFGSRSFRHRRAGFQKAAEPDWSRRQFLTYLGAATPPAIAAGLTLVSLPQLRHFRIRKFEMPISGLPSALDGLTLAHLGDMHVGSFTYGRTLKAIVEATNRLRVDLVLLPGDLINNDIKDLPDAIEAVHALEGRHGVFLSEGNHDLIPGPTAFRENSKRAGLKLLVNETRTIEIRGEPVQLMGLRWGSGPGSNRPAAYSDEAIALSMEELLKKRNPAAFPILMAHHPHAFDPAAEAGIPLVLAGHTHGGQLMINENFGFGPAMYRYWSGTYQKRLSSLAVSNGVGNWFPLRTRAPAEILHLTLRRAANR